MASHQAVHVKLNYWLAYTISRNHMMAGVQMDIAILDFSKDFHTVPHKKLLKK